VLSYSLVLPQESLPFSVRRLHFPSMYTAKLWVVTTWSQWMDPESRPEKLDQGRQPVMIDLA